MFRRLLSLLLVAGLALGGGPGCCIPAASAGGSQDAPERVDGLVHHGGGCHEASIGEADTGSPADSATHDNGGDCQRCSHCLASAPLSAPVSISLSSAPVALSTSFASAAGLPPFEPALRPPITPVAAHTT